MIASNCTSCCLKSSDTDVDSGNEGLQPQISDDDSHQHETDPIRDDAVTR
jgi:hypothetical protein